MSSAPGNPEHRCRICGGRVTEFFDFGRQPLSDAFLEKPPADEFFYRLAVGSCASCTMVQLMEEVPRDRMFHAGYPYVSSGSSVMRDHFAKAAGRFLETELTGPDPFIVELGCNDGAMLRVVAEAGVRHLGVEPSGGVADLAAAKGVRVRKSFFEEAVAREIRAQDGPADVIYAANTLCHIPYLDSILRGVDALLGPDGVFVFEDPYFLDIVERASFDQIYDEHFYFFTVGSVRAAARPYGLELVDVERLPVHGGEARYTLARAGARTPAPAVAELLAEEQARELTAEATLAAFGARVERARERLVTLLTELKGQGRRVAGYGATAKSATVLNYCGIGPGLIPFICDSTEAKQGTVTPGSHIPVRGPEAFADPYPDYAVLFAWNHAAEIMAKETAFEQAGGKWITYVPEVRVV
ncbi:methyltransferase domain-containing protein [Sphaerisporangium dianthi]|uniref:Methyltransferase domain-containing protein n=1 Tax=Sphaerisporangium dianthi TaxID=1436120 RepID=A0ABV9CNP9_9ACTN